MDVSEARRLKELERGNGELKKMVAELSLGGEADLGHDGFVTASEIGLFVRPNVTTASNQRQTSLCGTIEGAAEVAFVLPQR